MARQHIYFLVKKKVPGMAANYWDQVVAAIATFTGTFANPSERLQVRHSNDATYNGNGVLIDAGTSVIFEANFDTNDLAATSFQQKLASTFGVNVNLCTSTANANLHYVNADSCNFTFKYSGTSEFDMTLFGCPDGATFCPWEQSRIETVGYLTANISSWV